MWTNYKPLNVLRRWPNIKSNYTRKRIYNGGAAGGDERVFSNESLRSPFSLQIFHHLPVYSTRMDKKDKTWMTTFGQWTDGVQRKCNVVVSGIRNMKSSNVMR